MATLRERRYDLLVHLTEHPRGLTLATLLRPAFVRDARARRSRARVAVEARLHAFLPVAERSPRGTRSRPISTRCAASASMPRPEDKRLVMVPGAEAQARVDAMLAEQGLAREAVRAGAPGLALAVQDAGRPSAWPR